ncbi:MAG: transketolase, N-terminal subunit [Candidatus Binatia bacterium]|nr:MAG: transketolase, N-terminal subunit [Candidatus Binatia bacterium]
MRATGFERELPGDLLERLEEHARAVRLHTLRMAHEGRTPHVGSALSSVEILVSLYFAVLDVDPDEPDAPGRDVFVLSKGHGCMSYYATLAERGFFPVEWLSTYAKNGGRLPEHPTPKGIPGVRVATGSLGHGLAVGIGMLLARRLDGRKGRVFVLMSDGECNEGSVWEAAMFAARERLDRLVAIVDYNKLQATGRCEDILPLEPLADKWRAFGWAVREVDGHDLGGLVTTFRNLPFETPRPNLVLAHTVKGKGVSFMENDPEWHYRPPDSAELERAMAEVRATPGGEKP